MRYFVGILMLARLTLADDAFAAELAAPADYLTQVKPILQSRCFACHGPLKQQAGLRLDTADLILKGGETGPAIVVGQSAASAIVARISSQDESLRMPQEGAPLLPAEIEAIRQWIDAGANHPEEPPPHDPLQHWAFVPPRRPATPEVRNPIDHFIEAKYAELGLTHVEQADKHTLLRRVTFDLTGLPPTREELAAFLADESPDAYEKVVDRLLASSRYGERWARHWMDIWRYSDWDGFVAEIRESQPHIWRWRNWIVESLAADKPYDQMIVEMLSGDEIAPGDPATLRATGFLVRNYHKFNRNAWMENTVEHTGKAFLGVTLNCARCHDHKYDPIAQKEYYEWRAAFEPYNVRIDPVPGQTDASKDGLARVYDATLDAPTYLFVRGDEKQPDKEHPLSPTLPRILGGGALTHAPVELPAAAYYPGSQEFAHADLIAAGGQKVATAKSSVDAAAMAIARLETTAPAESEAVAKPAGNDAAINPEIARADARRAKELAEANVAIAEAELAFAQARAAADRARYASPPAADVAALNQAAIQAERSSRLATTRLALLTANHAKEKGVETAAAADALAKLDAAIAEANKAVQAAESALADTSGDYTPLGAMYPKTSTGRRLALAKQIADKSNPLTARVAVNHIWLRHFGTALVPTVFDFGHNGKPPINQPLLDWLAVEFMENGWRMKPIHRLIVTSEVYRRKSSEGASALKNRDLDRDNIYLWRMNPRRLEAEAVRDAVLLLDGRLDLALGGPDLDPASDAEVPRRSLYFRHAKEKRVPFLAIFDQASVTECYRRAETVVPQQALAMANSALVAESAKRITTKLNQQVGESADHEPFITEAFLLILGRPCTAEEIQLCSSFLAKNSPSTGGRERFIHTLLNHHDFVTVQ